MIRFVWRGFTLELTFLFAATVAFCLLTDESGVSVLALSACLLHETGHLFAFCLTGHKPRAMVFELTGIRLTPSERQPGFAQNLLIQSGGTCQSDLRRGILPVSPVFGGSGAYCACLLFSFAAAHARRRTASACCFNKTVARPRRADIVPD